MIRASILAAALVVTAPALAQAPPDIDELYKRVGSVCDLLIRKNGGEMFECLRGGTTMALQLRRIAQARPFTEVPKSHNPNYKAPPLPPLPSCLFAKAACPTEGPCPWLQQVTELIAKSDPCELPQ
jgi:hypothetical protein